MMTSMADEEVGDLGEKKEGEKSMGVMGGKEGPLCWTRCGHWKHAGSLGVWSYTRREGGLRTSQQE